MVFVVFAEIASLGHVKKCHSNESDNQVSENSWHIEFLRKNVDVYHTKAISESLNGIVDIEVPLEIL